MAGADAAAPDWGEPEQPGSRAELENRLDTDFGNVFPDDAPSAPERPEPIAPVEHGDWSGMGAGGAPSGEGADLEAYVAERPTLGDHLERQLELAVADPVERLIGLNLIDLVDAAGYLREPIEEIADAAGLEPGEVEPRRKGGQQGDRGQHRARLCATAAAPSSRPPVRRGWQSRARFSIGTGSTRAATAGPPMKDL